MPWNYRVICVPNEDPELTAFRIHECHYDASTPPDGIPHSWSMNPVFPSGESGVDELSNDLAKMTRAVRLPVLIENHQDEALEYWDSKNENRKSRKRLPKR